MKFVDYPREYEYVFSNKELVKAKRCDLALVSVYAKSPESINDYIFLLKENFDNINTHLFDTGVKLYWLFRRFKYRGRRRKKMNKNEPNLDNAFATFIRVYVGHDTKIVFGSYSLFIKIVTYIDEFFPYFDRRNPFNDKLEYPFKYMNLECLYLVHKMDERMDILKHCEGKQLSYVEFLDYVINYVNCANDAKLLGSELEYNFWWSHGYLPHIKKIKRKEIL